MLSFSTFLIPLPDLTAFPLWVHSTLGVGVPVITVSNLTESPSLEFRGLNQLSLIIMYQYAFIFMDVHSGSKCLPRVACLWIKMSMFQRAGMRKGGLPLPPAIQYLILMIWRACDLNMFLISSLASKCQDFKPADFKLRFLQFHFIKQLKNGHSNFEDFEDITTKFKSQALHVIRIKYWKAGGSDNPPSFNPTLLNIGILLHKHALPWKLHNRYCY